MIGFTAGTVLVGAMLAAGMAQGESSVKQAIVFSAGDVNRFEVSIEVEKVRAREISSGPPKDVSEIRAFYLRMSTGIQSRRAAYDALKLRLPFLADSAQSGPDDRYVAVFTDQLVSEKKGSRLALLELPTGREVFSREQQAAVLDIQWLSPTQVMMLERTYDRPSFTPGGIASMLIGQEVPLFQHSVSIVTIGRTVSESKALLNRSPQRYGLFD